MQLTLFIWSLFRDKPINGISIGVSLTVYFNLSI
nr:MAG TPA: hypothetical protein [Caudoviricetes sp.]